LRNDLTIFDNKELIDKLPGPSFASVAF
jgi:hypothetical protein